MTTPISPPLVCGVVHTTCEDAIRVRGYAVLPGVDVRSHPDRMVRAAQDSRFFFFLFLLIALFWGGWSPRSTPHMHAGAGAGSPTHSHTQPHTSRTLCTPHSLRLTRNNSQTAAARERGGEGRVDESAVGKNGAWPGKRARDLWRDERRQKPPLHTTTRK